MPQDPLAARTRRPDETGTFTPTGSHRIPSGRTMTEPQGTHRTRRWVRRPLGRHHQPHRPWDRRRSHAPVTGYRRRRPDGSPAPHSLAFPSTVAAAPGGQSPHPERPAPPGCRHSKQSPCRARFVPAEQLSPRVWGPHRIRRRLPAMALGRISGTTSRLRHHRMAPGARTIPGGNAP